MAIFSPLNKTTSKGPSLLLILPARKESWPTLSLLKVLKKSLHLNMSFTKTFPNLMESINLQTQMTNKFQQCNAKKITPKYIIITFEKTIKI